MRNKKANEMNLKVRGLFLKIFQLSFSPIKAIYICGAPQHKNDVRVKDYVCRLKIQYCVSRLISDNVKA